jgi:archaellum component FlaC
MAEWNAIGHVPFKEKDKIYKEYHEAIDNQFDRFRVDQSDRKMQAFRNNLNELGNGEKGKGKLFNEREKLIRMYERMKNELQTYENNIGFLSISSKGGGGLFKEMERKIEKLKDEMALTIKKIEAIDENLD